jgi:hypothetical protein
MVSNVMLVVICPRVGIRKFVCREILRKANCAIEILVERAEAVTNL